MNEYREKTSNKRKKSRVVWRGAVQRLNERASKWVWEGMGVGESETEGGR